jgi:hypothetical protein
MARFSAFLGRKVEVHYRAGDICLPASGTFVADSGRSIFLEQRFDQRGVEKSFRWEVPYQYIVRIDELPLQPAGANSSAAVPGQSAGESPEPVVETAEPKARAAAMGGASAILPFSHSTKTA